ncbi:MAG: YdcF family protein [Candidatus Pacebacteria bacterium]|nr:YdcF family protein [Candidatus Paceibacterota bacterium]
MESLDGLIVLGSQVFRKEDGTYGFPLFTEMRARAAGIAYQQRVSKLLILTGGHNFGIRYSLDGQILKKRSFFNPIAHLEAKRYPSEAQVIADFLIKEYKVPESHIILEEKSRTTRQNAQNVKKIIQKKKLKDLGLLTQLYHMRRAWQEFKKVDLKVMLVFAEDLLVLEDKAWIEKIYEYYSVSKGGKLWDKEKIRAFLRSGRSIGELMMRS